MPRSSVITEGSLAISWRGARRGGMRSKDPGRREVVLRTISKCRLQNCVDVKFSVEKMSNLST